VLVWWAKSILKRATSRMNRPTKKIEDINWSMFSPPLAINICLPFWNAWINDD
jgi:hypothetical protein